MEEREEALIAQAEDYFHEAWDKGDAKEIASLFTDDGVRVGPDGVIYHGRTEIEDAYDKMLKMMHGSTVTYGSGTIRILCDEFATWQGGVEITSGEGKPPIKGYSLDLLKKVDGSWLILEAHPTIIRPLDL